MPTSTNQKHFFFKIFKPNGDYLTTWADASFDSFRKQINSGLGECLIKLARPFDNFGENDDVKLNNRVDIWLSDSDTDSVGIRIYSGFISRYEPTINGHDENITVRCLGYVSKLATSMLKIGTYIELTTNDDSTLKTGHTAELAPEISGIVRSIIDHYRIEARNPLITYTATSIENTGLDMAYIFSGKYYSEAIDKCKDIAPADWYWYVDADNILNFKAKPLKATHTFIFGKHFKSIKVEKNMENVVNNVLFSNGDNPDAHILKLFTDQDSMDEMDDRWEIRTDGRVSLEGTANRMGNSTLNQKKDAEVKVIVEILDNNGNGTSGYDIESIHPGETCKFVGFNSVTSQTFTDNMQILAVQYTLDSVLLEIEGLSPSMARENQENRRRMMIQEANGRSSNYDTVETNGADVIDGIIQADVIEPSMIEDNIVAGWWSLGSGTRVDATSFTFAWDARGIMEPGDKIRLTDSTTKYFYVGGLSYVAPNTTVNLLGASTLVGDPTGISFSKVLNPDGFPSEGISTGTYQQLIMLGEYAEIRGWGWLTGDGVNDIESATITFDDASFVDETPIILTNTTGYKDSDPSHAGDVTVNIGQTGVVSWGADPGSTSFIIGIGSVNGVALTSGRRYVYQWVAKGKIEA